MSSLSIWPLILFSLVLTTYSQTFDLAMDDKEYLNGIQRRLSAQTKEAHKVLVEETKVLQQVTRAFIESKIKENLFKAVRARVDMELELLSKDNNTSFNRQARQEDNDDDDGATTAQPTPAGLLPQLANVVTTIFGQNVNVTSYLREATSFLPPDLSYRIVSAASLIDPQRFTSTTTTTTRAPVIINGQVVPVNQSAYIDYQHGIAPPGSPGVVQGVVQSTNLQQHGTAPVAASSLPATASLQQNQVAQGQNTVQLGATQHQGAYQQTGSNGITQQQIQQPVQNFGFQQTPVNGAGQATPVIVGTPAQVPPGSNAIIIQPELNSFPPNYAYNQQGFVQQQLNNQQGFGQNTVNNQRRPTTFAPGSDEDEESDNSAEGGEATNKPQSEVESDEFADDLEILQDERRTEPPKGGILQGYPGLSYAVRFFNRFMKQEIPTTTEYMNVTRKSIDSLEEEEALATSPATTTFQTIVQSGIYLYEGAREAYQLLQHVNKFLDRVGERLDTAGFGVDPATLDLDE